MAAGFKNQHPLSLIFKGEPNKTGRCRLCCHKFARSQTAYTRKNNGAVFFVVFKVVVFRSFRRFAKLSLACNCRVILPLAAQGSEFSSHLPLLHSSTLVYITTSFYSFSTPSSYHLISTLPFLTLSLSLYHPLTPLVDHQWVLTGGISSPPCHTLPHHPHTSHYPTPILLHHT